MDVAIKVPLLPAAPGGGSTEEAPRIERRRRRFFWPIEDEDDIEGAPLCGGRAMSKEEAASGVEAAREWVGVEHSRTEIDEESVWRGAAGAVTSSSAVLLPVGCSMP